MTGSVCHGLAKISCLVLVMSLLSLAACGGGDDSSTASTPPTPPPPAVTLTALSPASAVEGTGALKLTATGSGFGPSSALEWNGAALTTSYVSATSLTATILSADLATAGIASVTVSDASNGGASSSVVHFTIATQTAPSITALAPSSQMIGAVSFQLVVTGKNFTPSSTVLWNGRALTTQYDSATKLTAEVSSEQIAAAGSIDVSVVNTAAQGGTSNVAVFSVSTQPPVPTLTSISPSSIPANSPPQTLTFTGTGFSPTTMVFYGEKYYQPTYISATKITLANFTPYLAAGSDIAFAVDDIASGDVNSNTLIVSITPAVPLISAIAPTGVFAAQGALALTVIGQYFSATSVVYVNGISRPTTNNNGVLTAQLTAVDVANAGTAQITVRDPLSANAPSNAVKLVIQSLPALALSTLSPATVPAGNGAFTLTVLGNGFTANSAIAWNGTIVTTTHVSVTELSAPVTAAQVASIASIPITVVNPLNQGGTSLPLPLSIVSPSIDAVSFQINNSHNGYIAFASASLPSAASWSVNLGGTPSNALIVGNRVYVFATISGNSQLFALNGATGATLWGPIEFPGVAGFTYDAGTLFVNSGPITASGVLTALDAASGKQKWAVNLPGQFAESWPAIAADGVVCLLDVGLLTAFNESDGAQLWSVQQKSGTDGSVAGTVDGIYVAAPDLTADFRPRTGSLIWSAATGGDGGGGNTPAVNSGTVYSPNSTDFSGDVYAAETGVVLGAFAASAIPAVSPTSAYTLYDSRLQATLLKNGYVEWSFVGDGNLVTAPIVVNNYVFVGSSSGNVYALDATSGTELWSKNLGAAIPAPANAAFYSMTGLAAGDGLLVVPAGNTVNAFVLSTNP
jgi:outer membrane protein assembly factor BamB